MIDVARHFHDTATLRRHVDLMALHKLNVLHLHLTDDQGWRMPITAYPRLTTVGAHRSQSVTGPEGATGSDGRPHGGAYTRTELADLVAYAAQRGVRVVPEVGMPGHVRAALAAYPYLGNHPERTLDVWTRWGVCETVLGVHDEVLDFLRAVLHEVMDVFPSPYVHLGGDECPTTEWEQSPRARARATAEGLPAPAALHGWLLGQAGCPPAGTRSPPRRLGREPGPAPARLHGDELARPRARRRSAPPRSRRRPHPPPDHLPRLRTGRLPRRADRPARTRRRPAHRARRRPRTTGSGRRPRTDPRYPGADLDRVRPHAADLDRLAYPRLCALADRAWTGATTWADFESRLHAHVPRLDALGVRHHPPTAPRTTTAPPARTAPVA